MKTLYELNEWCITQKVENGINDLFLNLCSLEEMRTQTRAEARAAAQAQVEEQVKKTLEAEKAAYMESLTDSIMKERMKTEDEKLMVQLYVSTGRNA